MISGRLDTTNDFLKKDALYCVDLSVLKVKCLISMSFFLIDDSLTFIAGVSALHH